MSFCMLVSLLVVVLSLLVFGWVQGFGLLCAMFLLRVLSFVWVWHIAQVSRESLGFEGSLLLPFGALEFRASGAGLGH